MAERLLERHQVGAALQGVGGVAMPQHVRAHPLANAAECQYLLEGGFERTSSHGSRPCAVRKDIIVGVYRSVQLPIVAERLQACLGERGVPLFVPLAATHPQEHPLRIDVVGAQGQHLAGAQPRSIEVEEEREVLGTAQVSEEDTQLPRVQHHGPGQRILLAGDTPVVDVLLQSHLVEEAHDAVAEIDGGRGEILPLAQVQQVGAELPFRKRGGVLKLCL